MQGNSHMAQDETRQSQGDDIALFTGLDAAEIRKTTAASGFGDIVAPEPQGTDSNEQHRAS